MPQQPNIVLILTDDQRFDTIAALGNPDIQTPRFDALLSESCCFTHASIMGGSSGAVCMPSRAMLHTGRTLYHIQEQGQEIPPEHVTLGEHFRAAGYDTFGVGKWHNGTDAYTRSFSGGANIMFGGMSDHWNVPVCDYAADGNYPEPEPTYNRWDNVLGQFQYRRDRFATGHSTDLFTDSTIDFLRSRDGAKPFLAYLAYTAPHDPREMPAEFINRYDVSATPLPANVMPTHPFDNGGLGNRDEQLAPHPRPREEVRRHLTEYYAMITHLDERIGQIVETLKSTGQWDNTILVLAGDNGLAVGQHGLMGKQNLYDHSIRVPLLMAGPGIPAGTKIDSPCYLLDIFPTLCDLAGLDTPDSVEGLSLTPHLQGSDKPLREAMHFAYAQYQRAVVQDGWKLIEYVVEGARHTQLFDLANDPLEMTNLAARPEQASRLARLRTLLRNWQSQYDDNQPGQGAEFWAGYDNNGSCQIKC